MTGHERDPESSEKVMGWKMLACGGGRPGDFMPRRADGTGSKIGQGW